MPYKSKINPEKSKTKIFVNKLGFTEGRPGGTWDSRMVDWKDYDLWIILGGGSTLRTPNGTLELLPGDCLLLRPEEKYISKNNTQKPFNLFYIHFDYVDSNMNIISPNKIAPPPFYRHIDELEFFQELIAMTYDAYRKNNIEDCNFWFKAILEKVNNQNQKHKLFDFKTGQERIFNTLCEEISKYPGNSYKIPMLAKKLHYSYQHFSRLFKKYRGMSPAKFIIQARIKAAKRLLHITDEPIGRIADILNYNDSYSFSKQFHKKTGVTPSEYRKLINKV
jgi:AraC family transcriptional regulator of arabinose operon